LQVIFETNLKGGGGTTTLAINVAIALAAQNRNVLLIDGDEQATAMDFSHLRAEQHPKGVAYATIAVTGSAIRTQVKKLQPKYSDIIIDMGFFAAKLTAGAGTGKKHDKQACYCLAPRPACALWTRLTRTEERDEPASVKDPKVS